MSEAARCLPLTFRGQTAVVTGASGGIGAATAALLTQAGIRVVCVSRRRPEPVAGCLEGQIRVSADVTDVERLNEAIEEVIGDATVDYVVNTAGVLPNHGFADVPLEIWREALDVNLIGAYNVMNSLRARLMASEAAAVVNVTSLEAGRVVALSNPDPNPHYAASKAGLWMLTRTAALALAETGVRVNSVSPGFVATKMAAPHGQVDRMPPQLDARVPMRRFARPDEVATCITFLLSDQASYVTGADLSVDGGFSLT